MEWAIFGWAVIGILCHIVKCNQMQTYCGKPIWEEGSTYVMFVPAMIAGPCLLFVLGDK